MLSISRSWSRVYKRPADEDLAHSRFEVGRFSQWPDEVRISDGSTNGFGKSVNVHVSLIPELIQALVLVADRDRDEEG